MFRKKAFAALAVAVALTVPFSVFAASSDTKTAKNIRGFFGMDTTKLTDKQKEDINNYSQKMSELQKEFINKMVENGSMTKEQGDAAIKKIDEAGGNIYIPGFGMEKGRFEGHGKQGDFGIGKLDTSKLTDAQKADLKATVTKAIDLQKDLIAKEVSASILTKEQGDQCIAKIDEMTKSIDEGSFTAGLLMGKGGFGFFGVRGNTSSELTDEQKAIFTDYSKNMKELEKEFINKLVTAGLLTKEQGDAAIEKIDNSTDITQSFSAPQNGKDMRKGHFGDNVKQRGNKSGATTGSGITAQSSM